MNNLSEGERRELLKQLEMMYENRINNLGVEYDLHPEKEKIRPFYSQAKYIADSVYSTICSLIESAGRPTVDAAWIMVWAEIPVTPNNTEARYDYYKSMLRDAGVKIEEEKK